MIDSLRVVNNVGMSYDIGLGLDTAELLLISVLPDATLWSILTSEGYIEGLQGSSFHESRPPLL